LGNFIAPKFDRITGDSVDCVKLGVNRME
jgi:hypothetical protein